jgi:hypothetical protein
MSKGINQLPIVVEISAEQLPKGADAVDDDLDDIGGLEYWVEARATASPNNVVPVSSFTPLGAGTDIDAAIVPKGAGALLAAIPDGTAVGGNKRGVYAVDLQLFRSGAAQVASGTGAFIGGGGVNTASGEASAVLGYGNTATADAAISAGGIANTASNTNAATVGGDEITASGVNSAAVGGSGNAATDVSAACVGGDANTASNNNAACLGGTDNIASGREAATVGGEVVTASGEWAVALGGNVNVASGDASATVGGTDNVASALGATVLGGTDNTASVAGAVVLGGNLNLADAAGAIAHGSRATTHGVIAATAHGISGGVFNSAGDAQRGNYVLGIGTSDATPAVVSADAGAAAAGNQVVLAGSGTAYAFSGRVIAYADNPLASGWTFEGVIRRATNAASTALVAAVTPTLIAQDAGAAAWAVAVTANTTLGCLTVTVTGAAATTIQWVVSIETTETRIPGE